MPTIVKREKRYRDDVHERTERTMVRVLIGGTIAFVALIMAIWAGVHFYGRWQEGRLVRRAYDYVDKGDFRAASLTAKHLIESQPESTAGARLMATLGERLGDRIALTWRRKVVQAQPDSTDDLIALARSAIQFGDVDLAEKTLENLPAAGRDRADYHAAAAGVAHARKNTDKAVLEWNEALRLSPNDKNYQYQLAASQLQSTADNVRISGVATLTKLREDPLMRAPATRALIVDALSHRENAAKLLELARDLQSYPEATFQDRVMYLDFLHQVDEAQFTAYLTELEKSASKKPADVAVLLAWMSQNKMNLLALDFTRTLSPEVADQMPVPIGVAEISLRLGDWKKLEKMTQSANWKQFEFLRHAYLARALREQDQDAAAEREWTAATKAAADQDDSATLLIRTASDWGWTNETIDLLWSLSKKPEKQKEAYQTLYRYYTKKGDTQGLYRVLVRLAEIDPENLDVRNNLAQVSLLLQVQLDEARRMAAAVYQKQPSNPAYVTTHAYALLTRGDAQAALKVMRSLAPERLNDPATSAYYGLCLAAVNDPQAQSALEKGRAAALLPEEKELVDKALANLARIGSP